MGGVLKDLVDSGLAYRTGRGDFAQYGIVQGKADGNGMSTEERAQAFVWSCVHRLAPASAEQVAEALSMDPELVERALASLVADGRVRSAASNPALFESDGCVLPVGSPLGWEIAIFDHFQAMVMALCAKLARGQHSAHAADLTGGSTFSYRVWPGHPLYAEATAFLASFRADGAALRKKIATYNADREAPPDEQRVVIYAGQLVLGAEAATEENE